MTFNIISVLIVLTYFCLKSTICDSNAANHIDKKAEDTLNVAKSNVSNISSTVAPKVSTLPSDNKFFNEFPDDPIKSGALLRGFYVLIGVTVLLLIYFAFRVVRVRSAKPPPMVRKYGILTNRSDVEMLPLPLDDDDEEEVVFDIRDHMQNH